MKRILIITCCILSITGCKDNSNQFHNIPGKPHIITIPDVNDNDKISWNDIIEEVSIVPLEKTDKSLLEFTWRIVVDKNIYYLSKSNLLVFSRKGKFLQQIGNHGKGPGEYSQVLDFDFTDEGDICILEYMRLMRYSPEGEFKRDYPFTQYKGSYVNPDFFCWIDEDIQYIWVKGNRSFDVLSESDSAKFHLHKINNGIIQDSYYMAFSCTSEGKKFIPKHDGSYYMLPANYDNLICSIDEDRIVKSYELDFGKYSMDYEDFQYGFSSEVGLENLNKLFNSDYGCIIRMFVDMGDLLFLHFHLKKDFTYAVYNKSKGQTTILSNQCIIDDKLPLILQTYDRLDPKTLVGYLEPHQLLSYWEEHNIELAESNLLDSEDIKTLQKLKVDDNPVLVMLKVNTTLF